MLVREPAVAGRFYPSEPERCRQALVECLPKCAAPNTGEPPILGGILPHAGWVCSGAVAGLAISALTRRPPPQTVVVFGAVHVRHGAHASVFTSGVWETPLGPVPIDQRLAERICGASNLIEDNPYAHEQEHSIEVELPFLRHVLPSARLLPIMVPPNEQAHVIGAIVGRTCRDSEVDVVVLGSSDLTHYGPSYEFVPEGVGLDGLKWARDWNDRRMIDLILEMDEEAIVPEAREHWNACGAGAVAATIAAVRTLGATQATLLKHTTSYEVLSAQFNEPPRDAVGYAAVVFS